MRRLIEVNGHRLNARKTFSMNNLLDRLFGRERRFNWRYALRIALITAAFQGIGLLVMSVITAVPYLRGFYIDEMINVLIPALLRQYGRAMPLSFFLWTGIFMLPYWAVFALAALSDETNLVHRCRVWLSWLLMTFPFAVVYLYALWLSLTGGNPGFPMYVFSIAYPLPLTAVSPVVTFLAVMADNLVRQFFSWLHRGSHTDTSP